jgi:hypothetical protein
MQAIFNFPFSFDYALPSFMLSLSNLYNSPTLSVHSITSQKPQELPIPSFPNLLFSVRRTFLWTRCVHFVD